MNGNYRCGGGNYGRMDMTRLSLSRSLLKPCRAKLIAPCSSRSWLKVLVNFDHCWIDRIPGRWVSNLDYLSQYILLDHKGDFFLVSYSRDLKSDFLRVLFKLRKPKIFFRVEMSLYPSGKDAPSLYPKRLQKAIKNFLSNALKPYLHPCAPYDRDSEQEYSYNRPLWS